MSAIAISKSWVAICGNETHKYKCRLIQMKMRMVRVCMLGAKPKMFVSLFQKEIKANNADKGNVDICLK